MRNLLLLATAVVAAAAFAALSQAGSERSASSDLKLVVRHGSLQSRPSAATAAPVRELAAQLPAFARSRLVSDAIPQSGTTPRDEMLFGGRGEIDASLSRRVHTEGGRAMFAAPSHDRNKVCFALTEDRVGAVWALSFCGAAATVRSARPVVWNVNVVRSDSGRQLLAWGIAARSVSRVIAITSVGSESATPNADGIFVIDLSRRGVPAQIVTADARGRIIERDTVPGGTLS